MLNPNAIGLGAHAEGVAVKRVKTRGASNQSRSINPVGLLQSWIDADESEVAEQKATGDFLIQALDADRLSDRKLFPLELKDVTW